MPRHIYMREAEEKLAYVIDKETNAADRKQEGFLREMKRLGYEDPKKNVYHTPMVWKVERRLQEFCEKKDMMELYSERI